MIRIQFLVAKAHHQQRWQPFHPPAKAPDHVKRRIIRPVGVLHDHHRRSRRNTHLVQQRIHELVHRPRPAQRGATARHVPKRRQRPRRQQPLTRAEEDPHRALGLLRELVQQRGLPDPRLPGDKHETAFAPPGRSHRHAQLPKLVIALQQQRPRPPVRWAPHLGVEDDVAIEIPHVAAKLTYEALPESRPTWFGATSQKQLNSSCLL